MIFEETISNVNKINELISSHVILNQIENQIITRIVPSNMKDYIVPYNDILIRLDDGSRFRFHDILIVILGKIPKDDAIYTISFEFFARSFREEQMYYQNCKLSNYFLLYENLFDSYVSLREEYEYSYLEKFEIQIVYLDLKKNVKKSLFAE